MTTMQDVAKLSGVSAKTVSRVFNDDPHVADETRARVDRAMKQLNYVPNMLARTFRAGRASVIGIAVPDIGDPFFAAIIRAVDRAAQIRGMTIVVTSLGDDPAREQTLVDALLRQHLSGLIIAPIAHDQSYLARWSGHMPTVFIDREPNNVIADSFVEDDRGGAWTATMHLTQHGHERIAFIGDSEGIVTSRLRLEGYRQAIQDSGLAVDENLISMDASANTDRNVAELLRLPSPPTAIFSSNARASLVVFPTLQTLGRVDIAMVSFGNFPMAAALQPAVTVIDQDEERMGKAAVERIFARLDTPARRLKRRNVFQVELIVRASSLVELGAMRS